MDPHPLDQPLLAVLQQAGSRGELTPGTLRTRLSKFLGGPNVPAAEVQSRIHALWKAGQLTIEPPAPGRREVRVWPAQATVRPHPEPRRQVAGDEAFIQICGQLASAYHQSDQPGTKEELARLLFNLGVVRSDAEGATTGFLGRRHVCSKPLLPGDRVKVLESGWLLRNCPGDHLLSKSRVIPA
jgi:hypothetical protein